MQVFDEILDIIKDGDWHNFEELSAKATQLNENQLEFILSFMQQYDFIKRERKRWSLCTRRVKLNPMMVTFLERLGELPKLES
jgi:uncharacterized protein YfbU (UPF0304 family)